MITITPLFLRTKQVAERIAEGLNFSDINIEFIECTKKSREIVPEQEDIMKGDLSNFRYNESVKDLAPYDLIFFGFPTHGECPATVFNGYLYQTKNLGRKNFIVFNTCRIITGKTLDILKTEIERKGGSVVNKRVFKGLSRIKLSKDMNFVEEFNQKLMNSS